MKKYILCILITAIALCGATAYSLRIERNGFSGVRSAAASSYSLAFTRMDRADSYAISLTKGDSLCVDHEISGGHVDLSIRDASGRSICTRRDISSGHFVLRIPSTGCYTVTVEARHAAGTIRVLHDNTATYL